LALRLAIGAALKLHDTPWERGCCYDR
jgi:hypothetical protein